MKTIIGVIAVGCMLATTVQAQTLIWSNEFNSAGTSAPDSDVWSYDTGYGNGGWGNSELQYYTSDAANVKVESGNLVITAVKSGSGASSTFTSARIKTLNKLTFKYGTVEARIQTPDLADGLWPAFWTMGNNKPTVGWPSCGEIDIMEMGYGDAISAGTINKMVGSAAHWESGGTHASYGNSKTMTSDIDNTFVVYKLVWTPDLIETYINGLKIWQMSISAGAAGDLEEFHEPQFLLLNLAVGGQLTGIYDASDITAGFPAEYKIDYIRIYDNGDTVLGGSSEVEPPDPVTGSNLLTNAGFETSTTGWTTSLSGGSATTPSTYANSGTSSLMLDSTGAGAWNSPNLSQTFAAAPGDEFNLSGYILMPSAAPITDTSFGLFKMEFMDSGGTSLSPASISIGGAATAPYYGAESDVHVSSASATDTWIFSGTQAVAPVGTVSVRFIAMNVNQGVAPSPLYFDDVQAVLIGDPPVFTIDPITKANATEDVAYTGQTVAGAATNVDSDPLSYSLVPGGPAWLSVATNGVLSGTPGNADVGANSWTLQVSDGNGGTDTATLNITVANVNDAPVFTTDPINKASATEDAAYTGQTVAGAATDVDAGATQSYSLVPGGPDWLSVATSGVLSGTPDSGDIGANSWTLQVSDGIGGTDTAILNITVVGLSGPTLSPVVANGNIQISFLAQTNVSYQVSYKTNLTDSTWTIIETIDGDDTTNSVSYETSDPTRFYRVLIP